MKPLGEARNQATARRVWADPRWASTRLIVIKERGASPVKRLRDGDPVVVEEAGTVARARPRSPRRRRAGWRPGPGRARGRTSGTPGSRRWCRAGCPSGWPAWCTAAAGSRSGARSRPRPASAGWWARCRLDGHWSTGNGTPSSCTNTTPSTSRSGRVIRRRARRASEVTRPSSVPAVVAQEMSVPTTALTHVAESAVQAVDSIPGTERIATYMTSAWPPRATSSTASQPTRADSSTMTGRSTRPTAPATAATAA